MLTMHADHAVLADAIRAGAVGYLVKDCSVDEVAGDRSAGCDRRDGAVAASSPRRCSTRSARSTQPATKDEDRLITKREEEVLQLIADGCSTPEVAGKLYISQKTVKNHLASIYQKLDARDRTQAVLQAVRMGIVHLR